MPDSHAAGSRACPCGWTGEYVYAGSMTGRKECPRCGRYESEARNATPDRAADDRPFPIPLKTDPMVPPGKVELRDGDGIVKRIDLEQEMRRDD